MMCFANPSAKRDHFGIPEMNTRVCRKYLVLWIWAECGVARKGVSVDTIIHIGFFIGSFNAPRSMTYSPWT